MDVVYILLNEGKISDSFKVNMKVFSVVIDVIVKFMKDEEGVVVIFTNLDVNLFNEGTKIKPATAICDGMMYVALIKDNVKIIV